ncbi:MAG: hypothetical protein K0Q93_2158 [Nocardioidaceae bacterium]|jgi:hypothetical protein|nr:hypothetical protein [Nocardioidaceae bacterium]
MPLRQMLILRELRRVCAQLDHHLQRAVDCIASPAFAPPERAAQADQAHLQLVHVHRLLARRDELLLDLAGQLRRTS